MRTNGTSVDFLIENENWLIDHFYLVMNKLYYTTVSVKFNKNIKCKMICGYLHDYLRINNSSLFPDVIDQRFKYGTDNYLIKNNYGITSVKKLTHDLSR